MKENTELMKQLYKAFSERNIETILGMLRLNRFANMFFIEHAQHN
jgi:hypothetical protein